MEQVPRQLKTKPISTEQLCFPRVDIWQHYVINTARLEPVFYFRKELLRAVYMLQHVEAGDDIKTVRDKRCIQHVANKNICSGSRSRFFGRCGFHLNAIELPVVAAHSAEKSARTATQVEQVAAILIMRNQIALIAPACHRYARE